MDTIAVNGSVGISYHVWVVGGMAVAIVAMAIYIVRTNSKLEKIAKESNIVITKNSASLDANTKSHDRIYEYFVKAEPKRKKG